MISEKDVQEFYRECFDVAERTGERTAMYGVIFNSMQTRFSGYYIQENTVTLIDAINYIKDNVTIERDLSANNILGLVDYGDGVLHNRTHHSFKHFYYNGSNMYHFDVPILGEDFLLSDDPETLLSFHSTMKTSFRRPAPTITVFTEGSFRSSEFYDNEVLRVSWDDIILPEETKSGIYKILSSFVDDKDYYESLGSVWKRGIMMIGPTGTGKTMICKASSALARDVGLKVLYVKDLVSDTPPDGVIKKVFCRAREMSPCLLIFEDVDSIVDKASRSVFLNELDGFNSNEGMIILASSNYPERLDPAFLKRPSRFDKVYEIDLPDYDMRYEFALHLVDNYTYGVLVEGDKEDFCDSVAKKSERLSIPYLKESFISAAMKVKEDDAGVFDDVVFEELKSMKKLAKNLDRPERTADFTNHNRAGFDAAMARGKEE